LELLLRFETTAGMSGVGATPSSYARRRKTAHHLLRTLDGPRLR
jgi:hypothetical protein